MFRQKVIMVKSHSGSHLYSARLSGSSNHPWADPEGGTVGLDPFYTNHKNIGFLSKTGPDPLKNHKATKPAFNVGQSSAHQRNTI